MTILCGQTKSLASGIKKATGLRSLVWLIGLGGWVAG